MSIKQPKKIWRSWARISNCHKLSNLRILSPCQAFVPTSLVSHILQLPPGASGLASKWILQPREKEQMLDFECFVPEFYAGTSSLCTGFGWFWPVDGLFFSSVWMHGYCMRWICEYTLHHACIVCLLHVLYVYNYFTIGGLISNICIYIYLHINMYSYHRCWRMKFHEPDPRST